MIADPAWTLGLADTSYGQSPIDLDDYINPGHFPGLMLLDPEGRTVATQIPLEQLEGTVAPRLTDWA